MIGKVKDYFLIYLCIFIYLFIYFECIVLKLYNMYLVKFW